MLDLTKVRIVMDSSGDILTFPDIATGQAPLKIHTDENEYIDTPALDVSAMTRALASYRGKSTTSCPSVGDFLEAFGEAEYVFCITITANLSGTYQVAMTAAQQYRDMHPERHVCVIDSRNTGPGMRLIAERIVALLREGRSFEEVARQAQAYRFETELLFLLESMHNLANNGRVNRAVAKLAGVLGVRLLGRAVDGRIKPVAKPRGEKKALDIMLAQIQELGYHGGRVRISHCENRAAAQAVRERIVALYPAAEVEIYEARGLCSFYAERGGLLVGFEIADEFC